MKNLYPCRFASPPSAGSAPRSPGLSASSSARSRSRTRTAPRTTSISDLGALTASHAWLYNRIATNLTGILIVVFALGLWRVLASTKLGQGGAALLVVMGVGQFLDGIFRLDCRGIDAGCVNESWHAEAHRIESGFTSTALLLAPIVLALAFRQRREWHALWIPTVAVVPAVILVSGFAASSGNGAASRAGAIVWFIWLALAAAWLFRLRLNPE